MLAIRAERAFDGERLVRGGVVALLDEGRIVAAGRDATVVPADARVVDFPTATVLPGLVDAHVHLCGDGRPGALDRLPEYDDPGLAGVISSSLAGQLAAGVTSVRDLGDRRAAVLDWRSRTGTPAGPHSAVPTIVASGPPITSRDGHCANMGGEATGPEQLRAAVRDRVRARCRPGQGDGQWRGHDTGLRPAAVPVPARRVARSRGGGACGRVAGDRARARPARGRAGGGRRG